MMTFNRRLEAAQERIREILQRSTATGTDNSPLTECLEELSACLDDLQDSAPAPRQDECYRLLFDRLLESFILFAIVRDDAGEPVDYRFQEVNAQGESALGYAKGELVGRSRFDIDQEGAGVFKAVFDRVARTGEPAHEEIFCPLHKRHLEMTVCRPQYDQLAVTTYDITRRREAEAKLAHAHQHLQELEFILNRSPAVAFLWKAVEGWPVEFVSENVSMFGYSPQEFLGGGLLFGDIVHPDDRERVSLEVARYEREGAVAFTQVYRIFTRAGEVRWVDDRTWIRRNGAGAVTHYQGIVLDITGRVEAEEQRKLAFRQIEQNMEQFAILADHVRHPLQVILARADLLEDEETARSLREQVRRIDAYVEQLDQGWVESRKIRAFLRRNELV
jgi:PAS domain S-box-containing protein